VPLVINLGWMPPQLFRNRERTEHWGVRQKFSKQCREDSRIATLASLMENQIFRIPDNDIPISIYFYPPDKRRRDVDGMHSAIKASLDGIADALGIDDQRFNPTQLVRCNPQKGGKVKVIIG